MSMVSICGDCAKIEVERGYIRTAGGNILEDHVRTALIPTPQRAAVG